MNIDVFFNVLEYRLLGGEIEKKEKSGDKESHNIAILYTRYSSCNETINYNGSI